MAPRATARTILGFGPFLLLLQLGGPAARAAEPDIPEAAGFVNDHAALLNEGQRARLEAFLDQLRQRTGVEFAVLTVRTTAPLSPSEYKVKVFERWGIGRKEQDDGLLMLVAVEEREVRFETGYGLEGTLPDGLQSRIFREQMAPRFRADDFPGGITAGVLECARRIAAERGATLEWDGRELRYDPAPPRRNVPRTLLLMFVGILVVTIILARLGRGGGGYYPSRRRRGLYRDFPWGGGFGGGWGGRGGFGGGSFGGFGGGSSGGGGGGGKW